jgi:hypothetical protein
MADPTLEAARPIVTESLDAIRDLVDGATVEMLNWRPAGPESNSPGVLVVHALSSTRHWLSVAVGAPPPPRDRPSEFRTEVEDADEFRRRMYRIGDDIRGILDGGHGFVAGARRPAEEVTAAWALLHAVEHLREHVGHLELTRDMWARRGTSA